MDGNGRWAKVHNVPKIEAYKKGIGTAENIVKAAKELGVEFLTVYAFSTENWQRSEEEVSSFMELFHMYLDQEVNNIVDENVRIIFIGDHSKISTLTLKLMKEIEEKSKNNSFCLIIALSYGGRQQIWCAALELSKYVIENHLSVNDLDKLSIKILDSFINPYVIPDPDLFIRTGGDYRISNFLLWQIAYSELYFTNKLWPDFDNKDLSIAVQEYTKRDRRYGK